MPDDNQRALDLATALAELHRCFCAPSGPASCELLKYWPLLPID